MPRRVDAWTLLGGLLCRPTMIDRSFLVSPPIGIAFLTRILLVLLGVSRTSCDATTLHFTLPAISNMGM